MNNQNKTFVKFIKMYLIYLLGDETANRVNIMQPLLNFNRIILF